MSKQPIEIYFADLIPETQEAIVDLLGDNGNYDIVPIATIEPYSEEN